MAKKKAAKKATKKPLGPQGGVTDNYAAGMRVWISQEQEVVRHYRRRICHARKRIALAEASIREGKRDLAWHLRDEARRRKAKAKK